MSEKVKIKGLLSPHMDNMKKVHSVWEEYVRHLFDVEKHFYLFKIEGMTASIKDELLMYAYTGDLAMHRLFIGIISGDVEFRKWVMEEFVPYDEIRGIEREYDRALLDTLAVPVFEYDGELIRKLLGRSKALDSKLLAFSLISIAAAGAMPKRLTERDSMFGVIQDTICYWLISKGILEDTHPSAIKVRRAFPQLMRYLQSELSPKKFEDRMSMHSAVGAKAYTETKLGRNTIEGYTSAVNWQKHSANNICRVDVRQYLEKILKDNMVDAIEEAIGESEVLLDAFALLANIGTYSNQVFSEYYARSNFMYKEIGKLEGKLKTLENKSERNESLVTALREKEKQLRRTIKEKETEITEGKRVEKELHREIAKFKELKTSGVKDVKPLKAEIERLKGSVEEKVDKLLERERENRKLQLELGNVREKYERIKDTYEKTMSSLEEKEEEETQRIEDGVNIDIPTSALVEAMKDRRIVIVGGDSLHPFIRELGFRDIRFVRVQSTINGDAFDKCEMVVYMTREISHSHQEKVEQTIKSKGVKVLNYGYRSIPRLVKEMFIALNS